MARQISVLVRDEVCERSIPFANEELMPGVAWGDPWNLFTPAYWLTQSWMAQLDTQPITRYSARDGVTGELVFCMLGGYGITAELATAAYEHCRSLGLIERVETRSEVWAAALTTPLLVQGRRVLYRFPNQKSKFIAAAMLSIRDRPLRLTCGRGLRSQLLGFAGVGYKTASWVARNVLDCDDVAILDIHLIRAGKLCGLFSEADHVERDYLEMEARFLQFSRALELRPAVLDCLIWDEMREAGSLPMQLLARDVPRETVIKTLRSNR